MIDTHTHLYMPQYDNDGQGDTSYQGQIEAVDRAVAAGVTTLVFPGVDAASIAPMKAVHGLRPENIVLTMGLHPTEVPADYTDTLGIIRNELYGNTQLYKGIGEVGMDLYWDKALCRQQMEVFDKQLGWAEELRLPVIIHSREALPQTLEVLSGHPGVQCVFHSFGGTPEDVEQIRRYGDHYFGINGIVTFKNSKLADTLPAIGIDRILTETDAPYLAPTPHRGKRNESSYIPIINAAIANALGLSAEQTAAATTANARRFFGLT